MKTDPASNEDPVSILRNPATVRRRAHILLDKGREGELEHFTVETGRMGEVASYVAAVIRENYPDLNIPFHSRWRHFAAGGIDRRASLEALCGGDAESVRAAVDLAVVSVLLDAGAGPDWTYREEKTGLVLSRSEGLGVASFHMFADGMFSSDPRQKLRVDADALAALDENRLAAGFQVSAANPMTGLQGRAALLKNLAEALKAQPAIFGEDPARPGHMFDHLAGNGARTVDAAAILRVILDAFSPIWPGRIVLHGENMGDVWPHSKLSCPGEGGDLMPFHKLSQWLSYSLLEPFMWAGHEITGLDSLTGLPEYRNGGLMLDTGLLRLRNPAALRGQWRAGDELIVEWRALTVALLDELRAPVASLLGIDEKDFPLACLLEGGTWAAGRKIAREKREGGGPPLNIVSDGTVF